MRWIATILFTFILIFSLDHSVIAKLSFGKPSIIQADALTWAPAQGLPPGAQMAVLYGNPSKKGRFGVRFKFPSGYAVPTHSHPTDEYLTVISGKARMAIGGNASEADAQPFSSGAFMILPAGAWHRLWADAETIIELHSTGPFGVKLVKRAISSFDPRGMIVERHGGLLSALSGVDSRARFKIIGANQTYDRFG